MTDGPQGPNSRADLSIGFVGLGNMGAPMAGRLVAAGFSVRVFDLAPLAVGPLVAVGAKPAESVIDCCAGADLVMTSLPRPESVQSVMAGEAGVLAHMKPGSTWVDLTTNRKELVSDLAAEAPQGVSVVESPVTGAVDGARTGTLTLFVGGQPRDVDRVAPVLEHLGTVIRCGALGNGNVVKLVTNQLWFVAAAAIGEGFAVGLANGVELGTLWEAIKNSVGDSFVARHDAPSIFAGHYDPSFSLGLCLKDLGLLDELGRRVSAELPMTDAARAAFTQAAERYGEDAGELHVAKQIEDDAALSMRLDGHWTPHWEK